MDLGAGVDGVELDLLDGIGGGGGVGGALAGDFGGAGADPGVGAGDVVEEDFLGLVVGGGDSVGSGVNMCGMGGLWGG